MKKTRNIQLTPAQRCAADGLLRGIQTGDVLALRGGPGNGKTSILAQIRTDAGGVRIGIRQLMGTLGERPPSALEESFFNVVETALAHHDLLLVDDLHVLTGAVDDGQSPRALLLDAALTALLGEASAQNKKLVFAHDGDVPWPIRRRADCREIGVFQAEDYESICRSLLDAETAGRLDYARLHCFAPALSARQLHQACHRLVREPQLDTARFLKYLRAQVLAGNLEPPVKSMGAN